MCKCLGYIFSALVMMVIGAAVACGIIYAVYPDMGNSCPTSEYDGGRLGKCDMMSADGLQSVGTILLVQNSSDVYITISGTISGLKPGLHGFHIHEYGATSNLCKDAGSHYNPAGLPHGGPDSEERHVGDLGNIESVGRLYSSAQVDIVDDQVTLYGEWSVLGRSVVIHEGQDDLGASGDPSGASGGRVACCDIYLAELE